MSTVNKSKKSFPWLSLLRFIIYTICIPCFAAGIGLIKSSQSTTSLAGGLSDAELGNGLALFIPSIILLTLNVIWGTVRWFMRGQVEHWTTGRIIGKIIGGGIWRILVIVPFFTMSLFLLTGSLTNAISHKLTSEREQVPISLDQSMETLATIESCFTPEGDNEDIETKQKNAYTCLVDAKVISPTISMDDFYAVLTDKLSEVTLSNIEFDTDASSNIATSSNIFTKPALATSSTVKTLNKAVKSAKGNFVVFYTDTGDDKISDDKARTLAEAMEDIISNYQSELGFAYSYSRINTGSLKEAGIRKVLSANGLNEDLLDTAMPIYVVNPYRGDDNTLATYAGIKYTNLLGSTLIKIGAVYGVEDAKLYVSAPSFPFINMNSKYTDDIANLIQVTAHELGHHYVALYSYEHFGSIGSDDNFIDETVPNWMAIHVAKTPATGILNDNHYNYAYLQSSMDVTIEEAKPNFVGYPAVAFLENYYNIVPDATTKIMNAAYTGDALTHLYINATENYFQQVMQTLAEKNLTGDYQGKLINLDLPTGYTPICEDACSMDYKIAPATTKYLYFSTQEYRDTKLTFYGDNFVTASVVGKSVSGGWQVIESASDKFDFTVTSDIANHYESIAFAISSAHVLEERKFLVSIVKQSLEDIVTPEEEYPLELSQAEAFKSLGHGCYQVDTDAFFDMMGEFMNLGSVILDAASTYDPSLNASKVEYDREVATVSTSLAEAKSEAQDLDVSFCAVALKDGLSHDRAKAKLQSALTHNVNIFNTNEGSEQLSVFVGFNAFARSGKVHVLITDNSSRGPSSGLLTINISEK